MRNATIFRLIEFAPGLAARNHGTDSIDYIVVIAGEVDMRLYSPSSWWTPSRSRSVGRCPGRGDQGAA